MDLNRKDNGDNVYKQYGANGPIAGIEKDIIRHVIDTTEGQSGSPMLYELR